MSDDFTSFAARLGELRNRAVSPQRAEMRRLADAMRLVIDRLVATRAPADKIEHATVALENAARLLEGYPRGNTFEGFAESANSGDPHAFFDHSPMIGLANPLAPPLRLTVEEGRVVGTVRFGAAYEGPPGCVHGGFIAAAFDEVLGMAQSMGGRPGMTGTLTVRYRRPTPLHAELRFDAGLDRMEGRKNFTSGRLLHGDEVTAEAEAIFVTVDFAKIAELYARSDRSDRSTPES